MSVILAAKALGGLLGTGVVPASFFLLPPSSWDWVLVLVVKGHSDKFFMWNLIENSDSSEEVWKDLQKRVNRETAEYYWLQTAKTKDLSKRDNPKNGKELWYWCREMASKRFNYWFITKDILNRVEAIKRHCMRRIGDDIEQNKKIKSGEESKEFLESKLSELSTHDSSENGQLDEKLSNLRDNHGKESNREAKWRELRDWCLGAYGRVYNEYNWTVQGEEKGEPKYNIDIWKLANHYCKTS